jgi:hypothetical protein
MWVLGCPVKNQGKLCTTTSNQNGGKRKFLVVFSLRGSWIHATKQRV